MAPLPADSTPRVLIRYTSGGTPHVSEMRFATTVVPADVLENVNSIIEKMLPCMDATDAVFGADYIAEGTNISYPLEGALVGVGTNTGGSLTDKAKSAFISRTGKTINGRQVRITFFSIHLNALTETRYPETGLPANFAEWFGEVAINDLVAIDDVNPAWKGYANIGWNAHFQRAFR